LTRIKIIDFGSGRYETDDNIFGKHSTLQTQWYRAPEIILGMTYNKAIDMWSVGCILVELYICGHLFPGQNDGDKLARIMEVLGPPTKSFIEDLRGKNCSSTINAIQFPVLTSLEKKGSVEANVSIVC
jgi:dual specificity tyrosine-phosphorylation-regulated kinase 2/3/4